MSPRRHFEFGEPLPTNASRIMAMGTWRRASQNPQAYAAFELDVTRALDLVAARRDVGERVTLTHVFAAMVGRAIRKYPQLRSVLRKNRLYPRNDVSLLIQVAVGRDKLSGYVLRDADQKTPSQIAVELDEAKAALKSDQPNPYAGAMKLIERIPPRLVGRSLELLGTLFYTYNVHPSVFGLPADPYGCVRLNNLGALGVDDAIGPFVPWMRSPGTMVMTRVHEVPQRAADGGIEWRSKLKFWNALDHRFTDAGPALELRQFWESYLDAPERLWDLE